MIGSQWVGYSPAPDPKATNRMDHVAFRTDDCERLRTYLGAKGVKIPTSLNYWKQGSRTFLVGDPEGNSIEFVEWSGARDVKMTAAGGPKPIVSHEAVSRHMIHAGFIVRDRTAEDHFYKDLLGFHLYWQGGMEPGRTDWVAMQVPDGTDWLEYMLSVKPDADLRVTGIVNHISLGVQGIKAAQVKLESHGWNPSQLEQAQLGRDGKWQLNLYTPDQTRIELMEFMPARKPCCSEFQGPHPGE
jgi:catechol 2,3-dioxygenase-like lactoylglutathione lyase family enzyme